MNRFIKTGSLFVLCTAASVALASPNESAYKSGFDFDDAITGYMNWGQSENTVADNMSERHNYPVFSRRADLAPTTDNFSEAINQYMNLEESEFAAAETISESRDNPVFSRRANLPPSSDNFSDAMLDYVDELNQ
jgi:hypothetical protein